MTDMVAELFKILKGGAIKILHSICQQIWKTHQWPQDWKRSIFILIPKKGSTKECSNYQTIALTSHVSNVMLKILQVRLQQHMNKELPDVQVGKPGSGHRTGKGQSSSQFPRKAVLKNIQTTGQLISFPCY